MFVCCLRVMTPRSSQSWVNATLQLWLRCWCCKRKVRELKWHEWARGDFWQKYVLWIWFIHLCCVVWLSKSPDNNKCSVEGHRDACNHRYKCVAFYTVPVVGDVGGMKSIYLYDTELNGREHALTIHFCFHNKIYFWMNFKDQWLFTALQSGDYLGWSEWTCVKCPELGVFIAMSKAVPALKRKLNFVSVKTSHSLETLPSEEHQVTLQL